MAATLVHRMLTLIVSCVLVVLPEYASPARAQSGATMVDEDIITEDEIEQRTRLDSLSTHKQLARQDVVNELIDDKAAIMKAKEAKFDPTSADVDGAIAQMCERMRITPEQLAKSLESRGIRPDALKQRTKADMARVALARLGK